MNASLGDLIERADTFLLDFDGPVCSIFAGYPAPQVALELVQDLKRYGIAIPDDLAAEPDPLEVLRWTGKTVGQPEVTRAVEVALCAAELRAIERAKPTPYGREVIRAAHRAGKIVAIVSNNSAGAIHAFLRDHDLADHVALVVGRAFAHPELMKPNPAPILDAMNALDQEPETCILIGDSLSDIEGARQAGVKVIAYANRPHKPELFESAGADAVVTDMASIEILLPRS